ncbi:globin domain-containing protein [Roseobacter sp. HKCCA0434]|uniref:globin domain-containing protein n=1 Tax=Roseobacter sp. HKCCA0434 TaxID=3079297 RepID=UPI002905ECA9|nr:globin domain-containing protein [Roseobacter sp. HKCCA0434]
MKMTIERQDDIARIRRSWARVAAGGDVVARLFYIRLFEISPQTRAMFGTGMSDQARKLMQTLNWIVDHVDQPAALAPEARALAVRHVSYGVRPDQYPAVGQALIDTLSASLGDDFNEKDAAAWGRVYGTLSALMIAAAYPDEAQ